MARSSQGFSGSRHTFLNPEQLAEATRLLLPPEAPPTGEVKEAVSFSSKSVSDFLSEKILSIFRAHSLWLKCHPILLGSWGRGELTPKSDLDLLFLGNQDEVLNLVNDLQSQGYRIRYRIPEDLADWSLGVEVTDWLSIWGAQAETEFARSELHLQQEKIFSDSHRKKKILGHLLAERKQRAERFDSIESFLEPQIKFGPGGLRDIFQGQVILDLFSEKFQASKHEKEILEYYRQFFLQIRQKLHLDGYSDTLVASEQFEISKWFGFSQNSEFMRQVQRGLARASFYSQWILVAAQSSKTHLAKVQKRKMKKPSELLAALQKDSSILSQYQVRLALDQFQYPARMRGEALEKIFSLKTSDATLQAVFRSRLIDKLCPRIRHLVGLVQHDQYHRFTADAHLLQACRQVKRLQQKPKLLGVMRPVARKLSQEDWKILSWAALYHDIAKGLEGDHSEIGEKWVEQDLKSFGYPAGFRKEVAWLVRYHLELSTAAFRKNPQAPQTWKELQDLGLNEKRLNRLALWTVMDICATNPDAWNEWKAKLLFGLVEKISAGGTQNYLSLKTKRPKGVSDQVIDSLAVELFDNFSPEKLKKDLLAALSGAEAWAVIKDSRKKTWIRYSGRDDRSGLLSELLEKIYASGASIQHALVQTLPEIGVYDWFQVQTQKDPAQLLKMLRILQSSGVQAPKVQFMSIDLVSKSQEEWVFSFRGIDQKGLLLAAALKLKMLGAQIKSARVHTWGKQIEDLFQIEPPADQNSELFLKNLREGLMS
jgi:[protein-PII] uridylyltransferase